MSVSAPSILITGAGGYIGSALRSHFSLLSIPFYSVDADHDALLFPDEHKCQGGILGFSYPTSSIGTIIHLAGLSGEVRSARLPQETANVNVEGTRRIVDLARKHNTTHVIFASTASVYDDGSPNEKIWGEQEDLHPHSVYSQSKFEAEQLLRDASHDVAVTILRKAVVYGASPHMRADTLIHSFVASAQRSGLIRIFNGGHIMRPTLSLSHALRAYDYAYTHVPKKIAVYNVATENAYVSEYAQRIKTVAFHHGVDVEFVDEKHEGLSSYGVESTLPVMPGDPQQVFHDSIEEVWNVLLQ